MKAQITSSKITGPDEVTVVWSDSAEYRFNFNLGYVSCNTAQLESRRVVSKCSAERTLKGTGC